MKILIFTEGTLIYHFSAKDVSREERIKQSEQAQMLNESKFVSYDQERTNLIKEKSVHDYSSYLPIGDAVSKIKKWKQQGAEILFLTSRRIKYEIEDVRKVLNKYGFPNTSNLYFRKEGETYKEIAEKLVPDVLIEDDCESIGGAKEMTITYIKPEVKKLIKSIPVPEFGGIDHLPDDIAKL